MDKNTYEEILLFKLKNIIPKTVKQSNKSNWKKKCDKFHVQDMRLYYNYSKNRNLIVIKDQEKIEIIKDFHIDKNQIHIGINKMRKSILKKYYWKAIHNDITEYVGNCPQCKTNKLKLDYSSSAADFNKTSILDSDSLAKCVEQKQISLPCLLTFYLDIIGPLSKTHKGNRYIAVITNKTTEYAELEVLREVTTEDIGNFIYKIMRRHGYRIVILVSQSCTKDDKEFCFRLEDKLKSLIYKYIQPNKNPLIRPSEKIYNNWKIYDLIKKFESEYQVYQYNWDFHIDLVLLSYNTCPSRNKSPYFQTYMSNPSLPNSEGTEERDAWQWTLDILRDYNVHNIQKNGV